jgi:DNA-directed RNA polymerase specialized sigma24 family protein
VDIEEVLKQIKQSQKAPGDPAWREFYQFFRKRHMLQLLRLGLRDSWALEDISQQAFLKFLHYSPWKNDWKSLPEAPILIAYFATTVRNLYNDFLAANKAKPLGEAHLEQVPSPEPALTINQDLQGWFGSLSAIDKQLVLDRLEGIPLSESASRLGISYSDAGVRFHRFKKKLKLKLSDL